MSGAPTKGAVPIAVARFDGGAWASREDVLAEEEPLEIRLAGDAIATTMRTPGRDHDLVLGFLLSERIIASLADVGTIAHCGRPGEEGYGNIIDVAPGPGVRLDPERRAVRRGALTTSACGVCGRATIDDLMTGLAPLEAPRASADAVLAAAARLGERQNLFRATGGVHGAVALDAAGQVLAAAEDVGRHNAVDKVCGQLLREGRRAEMLFVSGRLGFEIVQKAAVSRIGVVAGVSAPTSLAVALAARMGIVLAGFVRGDAFNVYAGRGAFR